MLISWWPCVHWNLPCSRCDVTIGQEEASSSTSSSLDVIQQTRRKNAIVRYSICLLSIGEWFKRRSSNSRPDSRQPPPPLPPTHCFHLFQPRSIRWIRAAAPPPASKPSCRPPLKQKWTHSKSRAPAHSPLCVVSQTPVTVRLRVEAQKSLLFYFIAAGKLNRNEINQHLWFTDIRS